MKIYTRTGDAGETGLFGGMRINKTDARIAAIGDVDELNANLGVCRSLVTDSSLGSRIERTQGWLFEVGAGLAGKDGASLQSAVDSLESEIDEMEEDLTPLKNFILPGGCAAACELHRCRAVCRRAERSLLRALNVDSEIVTFLNRLSDWLFVAARTANRLDGVEDIKWTGMRNT